MTRRRGGAEERRNPRGRARRLRERAQAQHGFLELDNVVLTLMSAATEATRRAMAMTAAKNAVAALTGGEPPNLIKPEAGKNETAEDSARLSRAFARSVERNGGDALARGAHRAAEPEVRAWEHLDLDRAMRQPNAPTQSPRQVRNRSQARRSRSRTSSRLRYADEICSRFTLLPRPQRVSRMRAGARARRRHRVGKNRHDRVRITRPEKTASMEREDTTWRIVDGVCGLGSSGMAGALGTQTRLGDPARRVLRQSVSSELRVPVRTTARSIHGRRSITPACSRATSVTPRSSHQSLRRRAPLLRCASACAHAAPRVVRSPVWHSRRAQKRDARVQ